MARKIYLLLVLAIVAVGQAWAQKACVIAGAEDHVPIREALIHTNNNHWARTDYRGYWTMRYQFDSATVSKPGYVKATIRYKELPDTVFLLPEAKQIGEVTVWGKNQEHIGQMEQNIQNDVNNTPRASSGISGNFLGWLDKQGNRDRKHLKEAKKIFKEMDRKDPIVSAYEKATGKTYGKKTDYERNLEVQDSVQAEKQKLTPLQKLGYGAAYPVLATGKIIYDLKKEEAEGPDLGEKQEPGFDEKKVWDEVKKKASEKKE